MKAAFILTLCWLAPREALAHAGHGPLFGLHIGDALHDTLTQMRAGNGATFWTAMLFAFIYGIAHAIGPGHGKLVVASYFASRKAKYARGAIMGLQIAFFHALSSIAIVVSVQELARFAFGMDDGLRYIKIIGHGAVSFAGIAMLANATHGCGCGCGAHRRPETEGGAAGWLLALGIGMIPCPGILAILFYAMSNQMLWAGICAVLCAAFGMAAALCAIGSASIFANRKIGREDPQSAGPSKAATIIRITASLAIMLFGFASLLDSILEEF
ncbi:MAG: hypothetical protein LBT92_02655 [Rickettsiales bacterium]|jgi:ABC-type nickel/cobalt efflux system permease component RcnA|nr:hypothetical protein [Rickettsiales bacterium]